MPLSALPEQLVRTLRFTRGVPGRFVVGGGGETVLFLRGRTGDDPVTCLWALDTASGRERLLADPVRLLGDGQFERRGRVGGVEAYGADAAAGVAAFALGGGLWTVAAAGPSAGALAALAVLRRPDVFHAAVAGAGVTDQRLYHAHWRERFLGHPDVYPERYEACDLLRDAPRLTRPLLIHGLADTNVPPVNTLRLSAALKAAGRPHELLVLPGIGHQQIGSTVTRQLLERQVDFLRRRLGVVPPRTTVSDAGTGSSA